MTGLLLFLAIAAVYVGLALLLKRLHGSPSHYHVETNAAVRIEPGYAGGGWVGTDAGGFGGGFGGDCGGFGGGDCGGF